MGELLLALGVIGPSCVALLLYFAGVAHGIALAQEQERFRKTLMSGSAHEKEVAAWPEDA